MTDLTKRIAAFISDHDPFGDHFSAHELAQLDPNGGYVETDGLDHQQLVARIKRGSKYWGQTPPNQWFDARLVQDYYHLRGNNNNYRLEDVSLGMRFANGAILDLANGKMSKPTMPDGPTFKAGSSELVGEA